MSLFWILDAVALTAGFTNGINVIWLDDVQCLGTETRLIDCPASPLGTHNCAHVEDAGVRCGGITMYNVYKYENALIGLHHPIYSHLHSRSHQTSRRHYHSRTCGSLQHQCLGHSV